MSKYALLFPGQGSQYVGMGRSYLADDVSAKLFLEAEEHLSLPLTKLMLEGPADRLTATAIAQPAILLHSIAAYRLAKRRMDLEETCALGHSLGEYSALVAAGVIAFDDAVRAVHIRGKLMQEAVPPGLGAMSAVIGMEAKEVEGALLEFSDDRRDDYAACANFNGPMQTVISGTKSGVIRAAEKLRSLGARAIIDLPVSAPFHCALMKPAQARMAEVLLGITFLDARFPIICNVTGQEEIRGERLRSLLLEQIKAPVRFTEGIARIEKMALVADGFLEIGPKALLSGMVKRIDKGFTTTNIDTADDIDGLCAEQDF